MLMEGSTDSYKKNKKIKGVICSPSISHLSFLEVTIGAGVLQMIPADSGRERLKRNMSPVNYIKCHMKTDNYLHSQSHLQAIKRHKSTQTAFFLFVWEKGGAKLCTRVGELSCCQVKMKSSSTSLVIPF